MRLLTCLGCRPEFIRLSRVLPKLDAACENRVLHTGQNHGYAMSDVFFEELGLREPDVRLRAGGTFAEQVGAILKGVEDEVRTFRPDRLFVLGDTNSSLGAVAAARMGVPVYHMEAGNRCWDWRSPEEVNRRIIDHVSTVHMTYTQRSAEYLVAEGIRRERVYVIGNPMAEVMAAYEGVISASKAMSKYDVKAKDYILATLHRAENVDDRNRLRELMEALEAAGERTDKTVLLSVHPHTKTKLEEHGVEAGLRVRYTEPMGFVDFSRLMRDAACCLTDSGTVPEECALLGRPSVLLRDSTERMELAEHGSMVVSGTEKESIVRAVEMSMRAAERGVPGEYRRACVSEAVVKILASALPLGFRPYNRITEGG